MTDPRTEHDRMADRNLKALGRHVALPEAPTETQRQLWKSTARLRVVVDHDSAEANGDTTSNRAACAGPPATTARRRGGLKMFSRKYSLPIGSAAAAILIIVGILATPTRQSSVTAATILSSLRQTLHQGMRITMKNLETEGIAADGRVTVLFERPFALAELFGDGGAAPSPQQVNLDVNARFGADAEELAGLQVHAAGHLDGKQNWVFVQIPDTDPLAEEAGPLLVLFGPMLQRGLLLDLPADVLESGHEPAEVSGAAATQNAAAHHDEANEGQTEARDAESADPGVGKLGVKLAGGGDDAELGDKLQRMLTGELKLAELQELLPKLEEMAGSVTLAQEAAGQYVLTATDFSKSADPNDADVAFLRPLVLRVAYREGAGVEWAALENIGPARGAVRLEFIDALAPGDQFERSQYIVDGLTTVVDVAKLAESFQQLAGTALQNGSDTEQTEPAQKPKAHKPHRRSQHSGANSPDE